MNFASIMGWFSPTRWIILAVMVTTLTGTYYGWRSHQRSIGAAPYITAIAKQKLEAAAKLAAEADRVTATNKQLEFTLAIQEKNDELNKQKIADGSNRLRALAVANAGRLRDPAGCGSRGGSTQSQAATSAQPRTADGTESAGLLSADLSGLLQQLTLEADTINAAYTSCRADALSIRDALQ